MEYKFITPCRKRQKVFKDSSLDSNLITLNTQSFSNDFCIESKQMNLPFDIQESAERLEEEDKKKLYVAA